MKLYLLEQVRRLRAIVQHGRSHDDDAWWPGWHFGASQWHSRAIFVTGAVAAAGKVLLPDNDLLMMQVEEVAEKKHGTYEDIELRRERQEQSRIQRRIEKRSLETKKVFQGREI